MSSVYTPEALNANQLSLFYSEPTRRGRKVGQLVAQYITAESVQFVLNQHQEDNYIPTPERALIAAVLISAVKDVMPKLLHNGETIKNNRYEAADAYLWFMSDGLDRNGKLEAFSFVWICEVLDLDENLIRQNVKRVYQSRQVAW